MPVTQAWRCAPKKAMNEDMLAIADSKEPLSDEEKVGRYLMAAGLKEDPTKKPKKKLGQGAWASNACIDAEAFGVRLGALQRDGGITVEELSAEHWALFAPKYEGKADKATDDEKDAILSACLKGVEKGGKKASKKVANEETESATPKKTSAKGKSAKTKANGKAAHV